MKDFYKKELDELHDYMEFYSESVINDVKRFLKIHDKRLIEEIDKKIYDLLYDSEACCIYEDGQYYFPENKIKTLLSNFK